MSDNGKRMLYEGIYSIRKCYIQVFSTDKTGLDDPESTQEEENNQMNDEN